MKRKTDWTITNGLVKITPRSRLRRAWDRIRRRRTVYVTQYIDGREVAETLIRMERGWSR